MNSRMKLLIGVMGVVGAAIFGDRGYHDWVEKPSQDRERKIEKLDKDISKAEDEILEAAKASDLLASYEELSLPSDPELAAARYKDWLLSLVEQVKMQQPSVDALPVATVSIKDPTTRKPKEAYKRYTFSLRGRGSLEQITEFLLKFYSAGRLQKIRTLSLNPSAGGRMLDVSMTIEAIGLTRAVHTDQLSTEGFQRLQSSDPRDYLVIARRNFFSQEGDAQLGQIVLSAVTTDRKGVWEAWFTTGDGQRSQVLRQGESLAIPAHDIRVLEIQTQTVLIEVDGTSVPISLGKSIQESLAAATNPG